MARLTLLVVVFLVSFASCKWFPSYESVELDSTYGFAPSLNVTVKLTSEHAGLAVHNAMSEPISITCNGVNFSDIAVGEYTDTFGCLKEQNNSIIITANGTSVEHIFDNVHLAQYYVLQVQSNGTTLEFFEHKWSSTFTVVKNYGYGMDCVNLDEVTLHCPIPIIPKEWDPTYGQYVNFTGVSITYPNGLSYQLRHVVPFILQAYWIDAGVQGKNGSEVSPGDQVFVTGVFDAAATYNCHFASDARGIVEIVQGEISSNQTVCTIPEGRFWNNDEVLSLRIVRNEGRNNTKILHVVDNKPTFTFKESSAGPSNNDIPNLKWIIVAAVGGVVLGFVIGIALGVVFGRKCARNHYYAI